MSKIGDIFIRLGLKKDGFDKGIKDSAAKSESFAQKIKNNWKGITASVMAAVAAVKSIANAFSKIAEFEQANANLSTILGKTADQITALTDSALALGRSTEYTASQVTSLQTELAKLGFNESQITKMQRSVLNFATAVGTDLASAAALTGSVLRGFGLRAEDTEDVLGALAVSTNKSALSFSTLASGLSIVMPVANSFGFSVKDTTALLGTLINAGFDASSAATATRNILLYLSDSESKLNKLLGEQVKTLPDLVSALGSLRERGVDLNTTLQATDKRAVAAFNALIDGASSTMELRNALEDTGGELERISTERLNTVEGSVKILQSAWEGLMLSLSNSKGIIKSVLDSLTEFINVVNYMMFPKTRKDTAQSQVFDQISGFADKYGEDAANKFVDGLLEQANNRVIDSRSRSGWRKFWDALYSGGTNTTKRNVEYYQAVKAAADQWRNSLGSEEGAVGGMGGFVDDGGTKTDDPLSDLVEILKSGKKTKHQESKDDVASWLVSQKDDTLRLLKDFSKEAKSLYADMVDDITEEAEKLESIADDIVDSMRLEDLPSPESWASNFQQYIDFLDEMAEAAQHASWQIKQAIVSGFADSIGTLTDAITGVEKIDAGKAFASLLKPMAEAVTSIGEMIMMTGLAEVAFKKSLTNPYAAIAAGAALVAIGKLASSGIQRALNGSSSASTSTGSDSTTRNVDYSGELTVYVEGRIKGDDIVISGQRSLNAWNR